MKIKSYSAYGKTSKKSRKKPLLFFVGFVVLITLGLAGYKLFAPSPAEKTVSKLVFDASVSEDEKKIITDAITAKQLTFSSDIQVSAKTTTEPESSLIISAVVPVTDFYSTTQSISSKNLQSAESSANQKFSLISVSELTSDKKLLRVGDEYYLDSFNRGALFREVIFTGEDSSKLAEIKLSDLPAKESVLKFNQTGVTAFTRVMMNKIGSGDSKFFSKYIGKFLADADITHVSNEVSFKKGCSYHNALFCSPPNMLDALKHSGVDVVELTGNHNNDVGAEFNTETIKLYHELGWGTFGGGINTEEAAKPWLTEQKGTKLALLGYNYPDSPNGGAISGANKAGANSFDYDRIKADIEKVHADGYLAVVDVQFWECYAYPNGYVEFPECDGPIPNQKEVFRKLVDLGADIVVGSSAHQPQTYEIYKDKPIYYGLGNLYFDQTQWPGTERGIILTHYFLNGKLIQTKLTPTVFNKDFQTEIMPEEKAEWLLDRLVKARP